MIDKQEHDALVSEQLPLFIADYQEPPVKGDHVSAQWPFFSLKTRGKDMGTREFLTRSGPVLVKPGADGLANQDDKRLLIYIISQLVKGHREKQALEEWMVIPTGDLYRTTEDSTGKAYGDYRKTLHQRLRRLKGTVIEGPVFTDEGEEADAGFSWIDSYVLPRQIKGKHGKLYVRVSSTVIRLVKSWGVLTYHPKYYSLNTPLLSRLYDVARFYCRTKERQGMRLEVLKEKVGSQAATLRKFRQTITEMPHVEGKVDLLDYVMEYDGNSDKVVFVRISPFLESISDD